jgi:hypothetical protein
VADFNNVTGNAILKELYDRQVVLSLVYKEAPLLAMMDKMTDFGGKNYPIPIQFGVGQGVSVSFATAQANATAPSFSEFLLTRVPRHSVATISGELLLSATGDRASFIRGAKASVDGSLQVLRNSLASDAYRSGTGSIAQVSTSTAISTGVITLQNQSDNVQFEYGQTLQWCATDGATPAAALGYVVGINRGAGTVTVSATGQGGSAGTPSGWSTSGFLLRQGDSNGCASGTSAWLPSVAPASNDNFYGVNRSVDSRLYGVYYDGSKQSVEEALTDGAAQVIAQGGNPDACFMGTISYASLEKSLGSRCVYVDYKMTDYPQIGFRGIRLATGKGAMDVFSDMWAPPQTAWLLQMNTWGIKSAGDCPHIVGLDGGEASGDIMLRVPTADSSEVRARTYWNIGCGAPGWNGRVALGV